MISFPLVSQTIKGRVLDITTNEPIPNAKITVIETKESSITDINGYYTIPASSNSVLEIEHSYYRKGKTDGMNAGIIYLKSSVINLEEIILKADPMKDITHSFIVIDNIKKEVSQGIQQICSMIFRDLAFRKGVPWLQSPH